jgi:hypothetical protein
LPETTSGPQEYDRLAQQMVEELFQQLAPTGPMGEELAYLTQRLEELFRQATKRFAVPSVDGCRMVAFYLASLRSHRKTPHKKSAGQTIASRYGNLFLTHLAAEREKIACWIALAEQGEPVKFWFQHYQELLCRIDQLRQDIETLLPALILPRDQRDPIRLIAKVAKAAWEGTNAGRAPRSTNPDDPLCRFVLAALKEIGQHCSAASVSEVLRSRRRKLKDGQKL